MPEYEVGDEYGEGQELEPVPVPWHFKLLLVATVLYLGWRAAQGVMWLMHRF